MDASSSAAEIQLPPGVTIGAGRETSATDEQGMVVQGLVFALTLPGGTHTSVFIPYADIHNTAQVQQLIDRRVNAILAITGRGG